MHSNQFTLILNATRSNIIDPEGEIYSMSVGPNELWRKLFKSDRPTNLDLEYAIEFVENCVMPLDKLLPTSRLTLGISNKTPNLNLEKHLGKNQLINLVEFEDIFNQALTQDGFGKIIAALLIIRECLHHLRFSNLSLVESN